MTLAAVIFFHFFGLGFLFYFLPTIIGVARSKRDLLSIFLLKSFPGLDTDRLGCRPGLGGESGRAGGGTIAEAVPRSGARFPRVPL